MKKIITLLLVIVLTSCGTRKVDISKIEIKKDSVIETKAIVNTKEIKQTIDSTSIVTETNIDEIYIEPLDSTKDMIVNGKTYKNVILKIKKNKINTSYKNSKIDSSVKVVDSIGTSKISVKENIIGKTKNIERKTNYWCLLWLLLLILIIYLIWRNRQRLLRLL